MAQGGDCFSEAMRLVTIEHKVLKYTTVEVVWDASLALSMTLKHSTSTCHAERSEAESKHLIPRYSCVMSTGVLSCIKR